VTGTSAKHDAAHTDASIQDSTIALIRLSLFALDHDPEAVLGFTTAGSVEVTVRGPAVLRIAAEGTAALHTPVARLWTLGVRGLAFGIRAEPIQAPLPQVA